jgi:hypothetical protein
MNDTTLRERIKRLQEVNEILKQIDSTIRPAAFLLLQDYIVAGKAPVGSGGDIRHDENPSEKDVDRTGFFSKHSHDKPADNVILLAAYHYSKYGSTSFTVDEMKALANEVGLTVPERTDMTFLQAKRNGKSFFLRAGRGAFRPTVHGEAFFKETYKVSKGTQQKQQESQ